MVLLRFGDKMGAFIVIRKNQYQFNKANYFQLYFPQVLYASSCYLINYQFKLKSILMANSMVQNCQRGIIFVTYFFCLLFFIFSVISLVKKIINPKEEENVGQDKYQEGGQKQEDHIQNSNGHFKKPIIDSSQIKSEDSTLEMIIKKFRQFELCYFPFFVLVTLNILTGTAKVFSITFYFLILLVVWVINVSKVGRKLCQNKFIIVMLQNLWMIMMLFQIVNVWAASNIYQPYIVISG